MDYADTCQEGDFLDMVGKSMKLNGIGNGKPYLDWLKEEEYYYCPLFDSPVQFPPPTHFKNVIKESIKFPFLRLIS